MFKKKAKVIAKETERLVLEFDQQGTCKDCKNILCEARGKKRLVLKMPANSFKVGEEVELTLKGRLSFLLSIAIFLIPTLIFLGAIIIFRKVGVFLSFLLGIGSICLYFFLLKFILDSKLIKTKIFCQILRKEEE